MAGMGTGSFDQASIQRCLNCYGIILLFLGTIGEVMSQLIVIGGGLAGCEAAWQAAENGIEVTLFEMRPGVRTGAHRGDLLAELVCSNSLGSKMSDRGAGLLREEMYRMGSLLVRCAEQAAIPAGSALAVDRDIFARRVTDAISQHRRIRVVREEATEIPNGTTIIASGPLTSPKLSQAIARLTGQNHLYFYDAIAPVVTSDSIDTGIAFRASRYDRGEHEDGDYINCPLSQQQYEAFVEELLRADRIELREFEKEIEHGVRAGAERFFEGCLPIEIQVHRGRDALAYGPMRPIGLINPDGGRRPYAVVQLRQDNQAGTLYNLVGFQTNLKITEQRRIFRMIPGLENANFARYGQMHRNTFIYSPAHLNPTLQFRSRENLFFAGQIIGVEGYMGNIASGYLAGLNASRFIWGEELIEMPETTMLGALCRYITTASAQDFQPMKANFGILPALQDNSLKGRRMRARAHSERALEELENVLAKIAHSHHNQPK